jgi:hypothetical protein
MSWRKIAVFSFLVMPGAAYTASQVDDRLSGEFAALRAQSGASTSPSAVFATLYEGSIARALAQLPGLADSELLGLFRVLEEGSFYAFFEDYERRKAYLGDLARTFDALRRRKALDSEDVETFYTRLVVLREFDEAAKIAHEFTGTGLPNYSAFRTRAGALTAGPSGYTLGARGQVEWKTAALPADGNYVVIVVGCHFADDAARALAADKRLADVMASGRVIWLFSAYTLEAEALTQWKQEFPRFAALIAYDNARWSGVDFGSTPTFNYFRSGKLVQSKAGWNATDGVVRMTMDMDALGFLLHSISSTTPQPRDEPMHAATASIKLGQLADM